MAERRLTAEQMEALAVPFPQDAIKWKPGATNRDKTRALALAYVDPRHYIDRLNEVVGVDWSDDYEVQAGGTVVVCRLTIGGVMRSDVGEEAETDPNTATTAVAQAFKRACVKFGLGLHLYRMPARWVPYDAQKKRITDDGLRQLGTATAGSPRSAGRGNGQPRAQRAAPLQPGTAGNGGNGKPIPTSPQALLEAVNRETGSYYNHVRHLFGALRLELGEEWSWPTANDVEGWRAAGNAGVAHVSKH